MAEAEQTIEGVDMASGDQASEAAPVQETPAQAADAAELEKARQEIESLKDSWTRERAEFQNFRKRSMQEKSRMRGQIIAAFVHELLPIFDNLQRVTQATGGNPEVANFIAGISMVEQEFLTALGKEKIVRYSPRGDAFNPMQMEAISVEEQAELDSETVLEVYQDGFRLEVEEGEAHVIRPARVKVGRPSGKNA
ncbi:MAG: nucleotide exchange factor GrpE [Spirochaetales bacterium]|nr:nucleotide exchange factor GrpE [Spirochaetales bacterium]